MFKLRTILVAFVLISAGCMNNMHAGLLDVQMLKITRLATQKLSEKLPASLETKSLVLTRLQATNEIDMQNVFEAGFTDPDVTKYLSWDVQADKNEAFLTDNYLKFWTDGRSLLWGVVNKADNLFIGVVSVRVVNGFMTIFEFFLKKESWGKGFATEAAQVILNELLKQNPMIVFGTVCIENKAAIKVLEKIGITEFKTCDTNTESSSFSIRSKNSNNESFGQQFSKEVVRCAKQLSKKLPSSLKTKNLIVKKLKPNKRNKRNVLETGFIDPDVTKYLPWDVQEDKDEAFSTVDELKYWTDGRYLFWGITDKADNSFIGVVMGEVVNENVTSLGYFLKKEFWGKGFATEAAQAVLNELLKQNPMTVSAVACIENNASLKVLKKIGMTELASKLTPDDPDDIKRFFVSSD